MSEEKKQEYIRWYYQKVLDDLGLKESELTPYQKQALYENLELFMMEFIK